MIGLNINHFSDLTDIAAEDLRLILTHARKIKADIKSGINISKTLQNKQVALVFEKPSTRTRVSFEAGINLLGGSAIVLDSAGTQLGRGETVADTARVLSRYVDIIMLRCFSHNTLKEMSQHSTVPVINGLTDYSHPCQVMADILTFEEKSGTIEGKIIAWVGDCNNMANTWIHAAEKFRFELRIACPEELEPPAKFPKGVSVMRSPEEAVKNSDLVTTDTWISMGDNTDPALKRQLLKNYQVSDALMRQAKPTALFMHCLPAHRGDEVTSSVMDGPQSVVWDEAENRLYVQMAIMQWCLGKIQRDGKAKEDDPLAGIRALVIEDNEMDALQARKILDNLGAQVTLATDGPQGVDKAQQGDFDVILVDCLMPIMNGYETAENIRAGENARGSSHIPIIGITAETIAVDHKRAERSGINDFIHKPLSSKNIRAALEKWHRK